MLPFIYLTIALSTSNIINALPVNTTFEITEAQGSITDITKTFPSEAEILDRDTLFDSLNRLFGVNDTTMSFNETLDQIIEQFGDLSELIEDFN
ncbi:hypothetical protein C6P45_002966 [Maudiozyma exigua]|uniref:Uncharacterized protein n=1 Tax=Maudiozyma exigua TaxID=34358 RepID=A0A9P6VW22_MAUEX|nr:hypothetical protein C6P45_002966 [Kazachstania exigua]